ncbi:MAG: hypothetical protein LIO69_03915 [Oscillospiraceae bacterium]|nr:hypothetical protein [Oscillospiraceae bacterium]
MVKTVSSGERITTVTLEGDECEVILSRGFNVFEISNQSDGDMLMSLQSGAAEGDDGAITVAQGKAFTYKHMRNLDRLYLTGTGAVVVVAANDTNNPFNRGSEGGDGDTDVTDTGGAVDLAILSAEENPTIITDLTEVD